MKTPFSLLAFALPSVTSFAPHLFSVPTQDASLVAQLSANSDETASGAIRKRDRVKKVVKNLFGKDEEASKPEQMIEQEPAPTRRKMQKAKDGKKYEKIECIEEKAYQILKDLDMIEEHN